MKKKFDLLVIELTDDIPQNMLKWKAMKAWYGNIDPGISFLKMNVLLISTHTIYYLETPLERQSEYYNIFLLNIGHMAGKARLISRLNRPIGICALGWNYLLSECRSLILT
ncbi:MAG: hypothetical protein ABIN01_09135 [Ferruginibacter sp.]